MKVYNAFHVDDQTCEDAKNVDLPPLDVTNMSKDIFLTLDVPPDDIPNEVMQMAKRKLEHVDMQDLLKLLHASKEPILSKASCKYIIDAAEKATAIKGWTKDRHLQAPTCDIPTFDLDNEVVHWLKDAMRICLFPLLAKAFPKAMNIDHEKLRIQDMFVVRYDADNENGRQGFKYLKPHEDESVISLTIALNDMTDYDGGGLFIASTGDLLNGDAGTVLGFAGKIVHGGYPVERGTRWILTVFLYINENSSGNENGYVLDRIESMVEQKGSS